MADKDLIQAIIRLYREYKEPLLENEAQEKVWYRRQLRAAKDLAPFGLDRIDNTMRWLTRQDFRWTLETVLKYITDNLDVLPSRDDPSAPPIWMQKS